MVKRKRKIRRPSCINVTNEDDFDFDGDNPQNPKTGNTGTTTQPVLKM